METYKVHFTGFYGYDVTVSASNEEEAMKLAEANFDKADVSDFTLVSNGAEILKL